MRRKIIKENPDKFEKKEADRDADKYDGLRYIINYVPVIDSSGNSVSKGGHEYPISSQINAKTKEEIRHISY